MKNIGSMNLTITEQQQEDVKMESPNDTKQLGEKSAFEDDVNMAEVSNTNESAKTLSNFLVSRSFSQESGLINPATLLNHKV